MVLKIDLVFMQTIVVFIYIILEMTYDSDTFLTGFFNDSKCN